MSTLVVYDMVFNKDSSFRKMASAGDKSTFCWDCPSTESADSGTILIFFIIQLLIIVLAVRLSWMSNARLGYGVLPRCFFALVVMFFPVEYLFIHGVNKYDILKELDKNKSY